MTEPLAPGAVIGILGGGQLGRMLSVAASRLGLRCHIYEPGAAPPAGQVAERVVTAAYDDAAALRDFATGVDVITYEFENIPTAALDLLEAQVPIRPGREALRVSQDRLEEKTFLQGLGLRTAPFADCPDARAAEEAVARIGAPGILKTRRLGYDGKGQARVSDAGDAGAACADMAGAPAIYEGFVTFEREISVIVARGISGETACFDPGENVHVGGILHTTTVPATLSDVQRVEAIAIAETITRALDYVGVMGVELFVTGDGLVVNEFAPRVHNSGHWTQNGCVVDQFEQHVRAVAGWALGDGRRHADVVMTNLIGDDVNEARLLAQHPDVAIHLYGKAEAKPGRKMGHVNRVTRP